MHLKAAKRGLGHRLPVLRFDLALPPGVDLHFQHVLQRWAAFAERCDLSDLRQRESRRLQQPDRVEPDQLGLAVPTPAAGGTLRSNQAVVLVHSQRANGQARAGRAFGGGQAIVFVVSLGHWRLNLGYDVRSGASPSGWGKALMEQERRIVARASA